MRQKNVLYKMLQVQELRNPDKGARGVDSYPLFPASQKSTSQEKWQDMIY